MLSFYTKFFRSSVCLIADSAEQLQKILGDVDSGVLNSSLCRTRANHQRPLERVDQLKTMALAILAISLLGAESFVADYSRSRLPNQSAPTKARRDSVLRDQT
jgi:hypothetical protein